MIEGKHSTKDLRIAWFDKHTNKKVIYIVYVVDYWFNPSTGILSIMRFDILESNIVIEEYDYGVVINEYERHDILSIETKNNRLNITIEV